MTKEELTAERYLKRGLAQTKAGNLKDALTEFDNAIELNPRLAKAYSTRAATKCLLGKFREAIADCNKALEFDPEIYRAYNNRGFAKANLGDLEGAMFDYSKAIELKPDNALSYLNRAKVRLELGDLEGAIADDSKVIHLKPKSSEAYQGRAIVKTRMGDHKGALADLDKAVKLKPEDRWTGEIKFDEDEAPAIKKRGLAKRRETFSFDEERDTGTKDYRNDPIKEDYVKAILNLQLPTETYMRLKLLERFGFNYKEAAKALGIPINTLWGTTDRVYQKLKKSIPSK